MKVVILCGGLGSRIRDVADDVPKPMIPIGGRPILWHIMKYYSVFGYRQFVLCLGYKGEIIRDYFLRYETEFRDFTVYLGKSTVKFHNLHSESDWEVTLVDTGLHAMTGARIKKIQRYITDDNFMLTYGDGLGDVNLHQLYDFHQKHGKKLTVTGVVPPGRFGEILTDASGLAREFCEKPVRSAGGRVSAGFFICRKEIFADLEDREDLIFERTPMENLVKNQELMVYEHNGFWQPMDTYHDYQVIKDLYEQGKTPWVIWK